MSRRIKTGIIGLGAMGQGHLKTLMNDVPAAEVTAVCDLNPARFAEAEGKGMLGDGIMRFTSFEELLDAGSCEAVVVVTPHPSHPSATIAAFGKGLHVLCDKPIASSVGKGDEMIAAWKKTDLKFSTMHSMRTTSVNKVIKEWMDADRLGDIRRVDMVCSGWLRTQRYYDDQGWRGTWAGEGSGLLLNQAPHNLDLLYWWFGPAASVFARLSNRFHDIETEDEVNGEIRSAAGFPIRIYATTGEAPGVDRVEIVGTKGTLVRDGREAKTLLFRELDEDLERVIRGSDKTMLDLGFKEHDIEVPELERGHKIVFRDFFDAIIENRPNSTLIAPGEEGIHSLECANAILLSSVEKREVALPIDRKRHDELIESLIAGEARLS